MGREREGEEGEMQGHAGTNVWCSVINAAALRVVAIEKREKGKGKREKG